MQNLLDIKKYTPAVQRLLQLVAYKSYGVEVYFEESAEALQYGSSRGEFLEAFKKDISKTANDLVKAQGIVNSIKDGIVTEIDSIINSVNDVFGECYDAQKEIVTLCGVVFVVGDKVLYKKDDVEAYLLKKYFGISRDDLKRVIKTVSRYESEAEGTTKAVLFPSTLLADELIAKITEIDAQFEAARNKLSFEDKAKFDVFFKRTGVTGIIQNSTYVERHNGIKQIAPSHKGSSCLASVASLINSSKYLEAVEVDGDGSLEKVCRAIEQIELLKLNLEKRFMLKIRKLGNHKATGICFSGARIVAEDVRDSSAIIHELAHLVHLSHFENNEFVNYLIDKLTKRVSYMDEYAHLQNKASYYEKPTEVVARACEIAGLFAIESGRLLPNAYDIEFVKTREYYERYEGLYFCIRSLDDQTKAELSQLFAMFFETLPSEDLAKANLTGFSVEKQKADARSNVKTYFQHMQQMRKEKKEIFSMVTAESIELIYANRGSKVSVFGLGAEILTNIAHCGGHKDRMGFNDWAMVSINKAKIVNYILDTIGAALGNADDFNEYLMQFKKAYWNKIKTYVLGEGFSSGTFKQKFLAVVRQNDDWKKLAEMQFPKTQEEIAKEEEIAKAKAEAEAVRLENLQKRYEEMEAARKAKVEVDFEALVASADVVDFKHTQTGEVLKVLKIQEKLDTEKFIAFNKYLTAKGIAYYSRYAKGFVIKNLDLIKQSTQVAATVAATIYSADLLAVFATGSLF